jgi:quinol-cytochrome oxidoreductase complex cytochrome b subunit
MLVIFKEGTTEEEVQRVSGMMKAAGIESHVMVGLRKIVIHARTSDVDLLAPFQSYAIVEGLVPIKGEDQEEEGYPFFPRQFFTNIIVMILALGFLVLLAGYFPAGLGEPYDPIQPAPQVGAEWYLVAIEKFLEVIPLPLVPLSLLMVGLFSVVIFVWPWVDRSEVGSSVTSRVLRLVATAFIIFILVFGVWGALT